MSYYREVFGVIQAQAAAAAAASSSTAGSGATDDIGSFTFSSAHDVSISSMSGPDGQTKQVIQAPTVT